MANVTITQLPTAGAITGDEIVPIVQNGVTVQTTTGAIAASPSQTQTFLTLNQEPTLPNSRRLAGGTGVGLTDGGAQSTLRIVLNGASGSLEAAGNGIVAKTASDTVEARELMTDGAGLDVTNGDGVAGNPTFALTGIAKAVAELGGTGIMSIRNGTTVGGVQILGTANQIAVANGNGNGNPTLSIVDNAVLPGVGAITLPLGSDAERPSGSYGQIRYNTDLGQFEGYNSSGWSPFSTAGGVTTFSGGSTGLLPSSPTTGDVTLSGTLGAANGGTGATSLTGYVYGHGTSSMTASTTVPTSDLSGTVANDQLANDSITINGDAVPLGGSIDITPTSIGAISEVDGTADQITSSQVGTVVTLAIADEPVFVGPIKTKGANVTSITPFSNAMGVFEANDNSYQEVYTRNLNNGSDASADFVAYNDASDVNSYFIDMGMNSSNFTSVTYPIFTPNSGYLFTGGGSSGQQSDLFIGTSNPASDIIFFTGDVQAANQRAMFNGTTGNLLLNTSTDTGYTLNVNGTTYFGGASTFGSTVLLNADPTLGLQAATKQYVDSSASTSFVVHPACRLATTAALPTNVYNNGALGVGATLTGVSIGQLVIDGVNVAVGDRVLIKNEVNQSHNGAYTVTVDGSAAVYVLTRATDFDVTGSGEIQNNAYFYITAGSANIGSSWILSQTATIVVGTTALPFTLFAQPIGYTVDYPLQLSGTTLSLSGVVAATNGGTGTGAVAVGDLLYGSATNTWSKLALGSAYKSLVVNASGTQLEWNAVALNQSTAVSGQLGISNGGTNATTTPTAGAVAYGNGSAYAFTAAGTTNQLLISNGTGAPTWTSTPTVTGMTISGGTANAVMYLNASKAVTTSSGFTFSSSNLLVPGNVTAQGGFLINNTVVDQASYGMYIDLSYSALTLNAASTNPIRFRVNATEVGRFSGAGFLGLNTTSPAYRLDVNGDSRVTGNLIVTGTATVTGGIAGGTF